MRNKFPSIIMSFIIFLIIGVFALFGFILFQEYEQSQTISEPEYAKTTFSDNSNTISEDIETPQIIDNPLNDIQSSNSNSENVDYSGIKVDKYFYNQLEDPAKTIYKALEASQDKLKTGTYKIELGDTLSDVLKKENGQDELGKYYQSAIEAYTYDNPEVFYISPNKMYLNIETRTKGSKTTYNVYINNGERANYLADAFSSEEQIDTAISSINEVKNKILSNRTSNTYQNIKMVHDYLVDNVEYDSTINKENIYNVYGTLVNRVAVCEGYAKAFKYLMDELQIPCVLVIGKGTNLQGQTENHAWNYVELEGTWYAIDVTWDDPVVTGGRASKESRYKYFLKGLNTLNKDHMPDGQFTEGGKVFDYPNLSKNDL